TLSDKHRASLALAVAHWEGLGSDGASRAARQLTRAAKAVEEYELGVARLSLASRVPAGEAAALLTAAMKDGKFYRELRGGLSAVAARMEPAEAAAVLNLALKEITDRDARTRLAESLSAVAARMESREAAALVAQVMQDTK